MEHLEVIFTNKYSLEKKQYIDNNYNDEHCFEENNDYILTSKSIDSFILDCFSLFIPYMEFYCYKKKVVEPNIVYQHVPEDFAWEIYLNLNQDLKQTICSEAAAKRHYEHHGFHEKRKYKYNNIPVDFDWKLFLLLNPDVACVCKTQNEATLQYENYGFSEKRKYKYLNIPFDFDWHLYLHFNPDLRPHCKDKNEATIHYEKYGCKEKRQYTYKHVPYDFDWKLYLFLHPDIAHVCKTEREAKLQYENYGHKEKRKYKFYNVPDDFDYKLYLEFNLDVKEVYPGEFEAKRHYETIGHREGRNYKYFITPKDFDWQTYLDLNPDIEGFLRNKDKANVHYEQVGRWMGRYYQFHFKNVPEDFDSAMYLVLNPEVGRVFNTEMQTKLHYELTGCYQSLAYKNNIKPPYFHENELFNKYFMLFHKYVFRFSLPKSFYSYSKEHEVSITKHYSIISHLHCYDIERFSYFFSSVIEELLKTGLVVITYCVGNIGKKYDAVYLEIPNRGMDVGAKMLCYDYLKKNNVSYDYILFLHSKNHDAMRKNYFSPFINNLEFIKKHCASKKFGVYVPPLIHLGDYYHILFNEDVVTPKGKLARWNFGNELYQTDLDKFFELNKENYLFIEGNCFMCCKEIVQQMYDNPLLYYALNTNASPDLVWIKSHYKDRRLLNVGKSLYDIYNFFENNKDVFPNNLAWGAGHGGHADNMLEHNVERLLMKFAEKSKKKVYILPPTKNPAKKDYFEKLKHINKCVNKFLITGSFE